MKKHGTVILSILLAFSLLANGALLVKRLSEKAYLVKHFEQAAKSGERMVEWLGQHSGGCS